MGESRPAAGTSGSRRNSAKAAVPMGTGLRPAPRRGRAIRWRWARSRVRQRRVRGSRTRCRRAGRGMVARGHMDYPGAGEGRGAAFRRVRSHDGPGLQLGAVLHRFGGHGQRGSSPQRGDRVSQPGQQRRRGPPRGAHADRRREHRRPPVRRAVSGEGSRAIPLREQRAGDRAAPGDGECGARDRRPVEDGLRAHRRPRGGRSGDAGADSGDPRPLQDRPARDERQHAERTAARAGPGCISRRHQGARGSGADHQRSEGVPGRRGPQGAGRSQRDPRASPGVSAAGGGHRTR